jgi:hypothetical protein
VEADVKSEWVAQQRTGFITKGTLRLIKTVTAFTLAHSITLGLATLGVVHVPQRSVEAVIALSIVFVAAEIIHPAGVSGESRHALHGSWHSRSARCTGLDLPER